MITVQLWSFQMSIDPSLWLKLTIGILKQESNKTLSVQITFSFTINTWDLWTRWILLSTYYCISIWREKRYWPHFINKIDVLKSAALKIIKITNPESRYRYFTVYPKSRDTLFESSENLETDVCQQYLSPQKILEGRICSRIKWKNRRTTINRL